MRRVSDVPKITKQKIQQIIKEELGKVLEETPEHDATSNGLAIAQDLVLAFELFDIDQIRYLVARLNALLPDLGEPQEDSMTRTPDDERVGYLTPDSEDKTKWDEGPPWGK